MPTFQELKLSKPLLNALGDLGFEKPTPIQQKAFPVIRSGKNVVGIAQTGTGKTLGFMLPLLQDLKYSEQKKPRILVLVPTRELVAQIVKQIELFTKYMTCRIVGVHGGVNIKSQKAPLLNGCDIVVGTPGRIYDLALCRALQMQEIKHLVIDEVDVMLDLGFRFQLTNIFELLPERRQNAMFSATMTNDVENLIADYFFDPKIISIAVSGTPLQNIEQYCYPVANFNTKLNLLAHLLQNSNSYPKVLVFIESKKKADLIFDYLQLELTGQISVIHSNKSQNNRFKTIESFKENKTRILVTTDVMTRGIDIDDITHVINVDTPKFPENYMHRIGRTGRAEKKGQAILLYTEKETPYKLDIERLMNLEINELEFPKEVTISNILLQDEKAVVKVKRLGKDKKREVGPSFHEKKEKNRKTTNLGSGQKRVLTKAKKYKKPIKRKNKRR